MKNKKILIMLICVVVVMILIISGLIFAYTHRQNNNNNKTEEQVFNKYMSQIVKNIESLENKKVINYFSRLENIPYESNGKLSVSVNIPELENNEIIKLEDINKANVTFSGKTDKANKKVEQNIKLNYIDNVYIPIKYIQTGDLYGIKSDLIVNQYITIRNEGIHELLEKLGFSEFDKNKIPNQIEQNEINIKDIKNELEKYKTIIYENLKESNFSETEENSITITLNKEETVTILEKMLDIQKGGTKISEKTNEILNQVKNNKYNEEEALKITIYDDGYMLIEIENTMKIGIQTEKEKIVIMPVMEGEEEKQTIITLQKNEEQNQINYTLSYKTKYGYEEKENEIYISVIYSEIASQTSKEKYIFGINEKSGTIGENKAKNLEYKYILETEKKFGDNINIEQLTKENTVILNDQNQVYANQLLDALTDKLQEVNKRQLQEIGLTEQKNPMIYVIPSGYTMLIESGILSSEEEIVEEEKNTNSQENKIENQENQINDNTNSINQDQNNIVNDNQEPNNENNEFNNSQNQQIDDNESNNNSNEENRPVINEAERNEFNSKFTNYQGEGQNALLVKMVISEVITSNQNNGDNIINVNGLTDQNQLRSLIKQLDDSRTYNITIKVDETTGYVNTIELS